MNTELLLVPKKHTVTNIERTMKKPKEILEFKMRRQVETFPFSPPVNLFEETKWQGAVTKFEATNSLSKKSDGNKSFSIATPSYWTLKGVEETIKKLNEILELRYKNHIKLHVKDFEKRSTRRKWKTIDKI